MSEFCVWCTTTTSTTSTTTTTTVIEYINKAQMKETLIKSAKLVMKIPLDQPAPLFAIDSVIKAFDKSKILMEANSSNSAVTQQISAAYNEVIKELSPLKKNPKLPPPKEPKK